MYSIGVSTYRFPSLGLELSEAATSRAGDPERDLERERIQAVASGIARS
jgi:hypothetical protein